jgi:hypothetical protein
MLLMIPLTVVFSNQHLGRSIRWYLPASSMQYILNKTLNALGDVLSLVKSNFEHCSKVLGTTYDRLRCGEVMQY